MKKNLVLFVHAADADVEVLLVQCHESGVVLAAGSKWELDVPTTFQWMPGGVHTINARYDGKPIQLTVAADAATAKAVQASYQQWCNVRPKQTPFGCVEHKEQEAALRLPKDVAAFEWRTEPEPGIYCTAMPTADGAKLVNGGMFSSWSPSFSTDAEYGKAKEIKGCMVFPKGVRGSKENPAKVLGCGFSVGSLTNKPAFRDISPVRASEMTALEEEALVTAAGTSAGAKEGWEHRDRAEHLSHVAMAASEQYQDPPGGARYGDDRRRAMKAHREASDAHFESASASAATGNRDAVEEHIEKAKYHHKAAEAHLRSKDIHLDDSPHGPMPNKGWRKTLAYGPIRSSEISDLDTVYAKLLPKPDEVENIYAKLAQPEDPAQTLYDRLNAEANG